MTLFSRGFCRLFKTTIFAGLFCGITAGPAFALDLNLEIQVSAMVANEPIWVAVGFNQLMPSSAIYATEIPSNSAAVSFYITDLNPGEYSLDVVQSGIRATFIFTLNADGTVLFDPSPSIQQEGNTITILEM